ncbi:MAG: ABC-F family ATP-binding cassette domain-containing protein [Blautia sp.]|jgi:ATP-binding cassette subfamily F protein uup
MNLLTLDNITKNYTERPLFSNASFYLQEGEKVGVLGINGTGKSTLLRMIAGEETPDTGEVIKANHAIIRYLPQTPYLDPEKTVLSGVLEGNITKENQWSIESQAKSMLNQLGITDFEQKCGELSGGQKKRLALVSVLLSPADILVLDEPTNHLDSEMADWLEDFLKKWKGAFVMVTHDRYFLDAVTNRIVEIDKGQIYSYQANYSGFLELKAAREEMELAGERKRQSILRKELEWVRRGARARSTKQKARLERYEELKNQSAPASEGKVELSSIASRVGRTTIELHGVGKNYGERNLFSDFTYIFLKNDRVGFVGPNGCGKTTLMKVLAGLVKPDEGEMVVGQTIKIGYYAQEIPEMDAKEKVIDYVRDVAEFIPTVSGSISASKMLERFLFPAEAQYSPIEKLSGGEKRRLNLLRVLMGAPNVLILDEPTNDLDITTLTILEDYLDDFPGIVITVSHDRYFLDRTVRRIFAFEDGSVRQYEGGYTDYMHKRAVGGELPDGSGAASKGREVKKEGDNSQSLAQIKGRVRKLKFSYQEQKDYETIEGEISALEEKIAALEENILASARDFVKLNAYTQEKEEAEALLEEKMDRWMYLEDLAKRIENGES